MISSCEPCRAICSSIQKQNPLPHMGEGWGGGSERRLCDSESAASPSLPSPVSGEEVIGNAAALRQRAGDFLDLEALDDVALLDVVVVLERHAALEAFLDLAHFVLEALEGLEGAFVDHHAVAQQAHLGAALDRAFDHHAAGDLAELGDVEDFADLGVAQELLAQGR